MFKFIKDQELNIRKFEHIIDSLSTDESMSVLIELEDMAISHISLYISGRYDTYKVFNDPKKREATMKRLVLDYMLFFLYERVSSNEIPEYIKDRYTLNEKLLMDIANGKITPDLPLRDSTVEFVAMFKGGSSNPFVNI